MSVSTATMSLPNPFLSDLKEDILFHLGPNTRDPKNIQKFRDTKVWVLVFLNFSNFSSSDIEN